MLDSYTTIMAGQTLHRADWSADLFENSTVVTIRRGDVQEIEIVTLLGAAPHAVWDRISTMRGVNDELWPLLRMTHPSNVASLAPGAVPIGDRAFRSWLLLFGVLPIDYDDVTFSELVPGVAFEESAPTLWMQLWRHRRSVHAVPAGTRITDQIQFSPRLKAGAGLTRAFLSGLFRWRHRRLRRAFPLPAEPEAGLQQPPSATRMDPLNPAVNRRCAFDQIAVRMRRVEEALGEGRVDEISHLLSELMSFGNSEFGLGEYLRRTEQLRQEQVFTLLAQACSEVETGFNDVRAGNVSAAYRCGRVASELIGIAVLVSLPRDAVVTAVGSEVEEAKDGPMRRAAERARRWLGSDPGRSIFEAWLPPVVQGEVDGAPDLKATDVVPLALCVATRIVGLSHDSAVALLEFRTDSQHPASHGSAHVWAQGLGLNDGNAVGIFYEPARDDRYRAAVDDLIAVMRAWVRVLELVDRFVLSSGPL